MLNGEIEQKRKFRFRYVADFEMFKKALDVDYDSDDLMSAGWLYKLNTPGFNRINRARNGTRTDLKQDIVEYIGNNCFVPTGDYCFF